MDCTVLSFPVRELCCSVWDRELCCSVRETLWAGHSSVGLWLGSLLEALGRAYVISFMYCSSDSFGSHTEDPVAHSHRFEQYTALLRHLDL